MVSKFATNDNMKKLTTDKANDIMTSLEIYYKYCKQSSNLEQEEFFKGIEELFNVSYGVALNLWYAEQRSWCNAERFQNIIDKKDDGEFQSKITIEGSRLFTN